MNPLEYIKVAAYGVLGALVMLVYYEGLPGVHRIPFMTSIPLIGDLTAGAKHVYADEQVKLAKAGMLRDYELAAAKAKADKTERDAKFDNMQIEADRKQAETARQTEIFDNERFEQITREDIGTDDPVVTPGDLEWLRQQRGKATR